MQFVPWRHVADWKCISCGECCRLYSVVISFPEWLGIVRNFGVQYTVSDIGRLLLSRRGDGSCAFLGNGRSMPSCCLQHMKPKACKLWPFKVLPRPQFGSPQEAAYVFGQSKLFVYADSMCSGLRLGTPTLDFVNGTLREFVEIAAGLRDLQVKTTSLFPLPSFHF